MHTSVETRKIDLIGLIDLGAASVETKGNAGGAQDGGLSQRYQPGLTED